MILTNKQEQGLKVAIERYRNHEKYVVISGYAGVGKSTLVRFLIESIGVPEEEVVYACYTGKAAQVLIKKGNKNAMTLHKLLYKSIPLPNGKFKRMPKVTLDPYKIVVIDECSMVPIDMVKLLACHNVFLIFLGDPAQLPPIDKNADNHLLDHPHIFLDEIMRQAQESEIIRLTMDIRNGKPLTPYNGKEVQILKQGDVCDGMLTWADQILCATNSKRIELNNQVREMLGKEGDPQEGDKVICLRNYWDCIGSDENALVNGTIGHIGPCYDIFLQLPRRYGFKKIDKLHTTFTSDSSEVYEDLDLDTHMILTGEKCCDYRLAYQLYKSEEFCHAIPLEFTYGYAITCWKAQGSEWDKVLVFEEGHPFSKEEHKSYLYTAATRAVSKLVIIKKD